jgi:hypothetical protein
MDDAEAASSISSEEEEDATGGAGTSGQGTVGCVLVVGRTLPKTDGTVHNGSLYALGMGAE